MLAFHGSPSYFGKFSSRTIGSARCTNAVHGFYFTEQINFARSYLDIAYANEIKSSLFIEDKTNTTSYMYLCEIPNKEQLLNFSLKLCEQSNEVQAIVQKIIHLADFNSQYKLSMNVTGELLFYALCNWQDKFCNRDDYRTVSSEILMKAGLKGVVFNRPHTDDKIFEEIVIFNADDIKIKQCFRVDRVKQGNENGILKDDIVQILFKRFDEYYLATAMVINTEAELLYMPTDEDCPEIVNELQTLQEIEANPYVIAYTVLRTPQYVVTKANFESLNYSPRKQNTETQEIMSVENFKEKLKSRELNTCIISQKVINKVLFAEYQEYLKPYRGTIGLQAIILNGVTDACHSLEVNALLLQEAEKPHFYVMHVKPSVTINRHAEFEKWRSDRRKPQEERKLSDVEIEEAVNNFKVLLTPKLTERFNKIFGSEAEHEQAHTAVQ